MTNPCKVDEFIQEAPVLYIIDAFYVFGGFTDISDQFSIIGKLDANLVWSKAGELKKGRFAGNAILVGNYALVIGGEKGWQVSVPTEKCEFTASEMDCIEQSPSLYGYGKFPELFLVVPNFCKDHS